MIILSKTDKKLVKNEFLQTLNSKKLKSSKYLSVKLKKIEFETQKFVFHDPVFESSFEFWVQTKKN